MIAHSLMGDPNASIPTPQPVLYRPMFAAFGKAKNSTSITFLSKAAIRLGVHEKLGLQKQIKPAHGIRQLSKKDMKLNSEMPRIEVDPQTYEVIVDGKLVTCEPMDVLPMAQRYFLF
jgi:urease subunit alpha